jgi:hypothetical protein
VSVWHQLLSWIKGRRKPRGQEHVALLAAPQPATPAGWWRDDHAEQLRHYQSWVYAAVNSIAQEVAMQRPFLYTTTGQAEHEQTPLPIGHPLARLLDEPNPWTTPWELWYLTTVYLELTGKCLTKRLTCRKVAGTRRAPRASDFWGISAGPEATASATSSRRLTFRPSGNPSTSRRE